VSTRLDETKGTPPFGLAVLDREMRKPEYKFGAALASLARALRQCQDDRDLQKFRDAFIDSLCLEPQVGQILDGWRAYEVFDQERIKLVAVLEKLELKSGEVRQALVGLRAIDLPQENPPDTGGRAIWRNCPRCGAPFVDQRLVWRVDVERGACCPTCGNVHGGPKT
jgi:hypothetical protein